MPRLCRRSFEDWANCRTEDRQHQSLAIANKNFTEREEIFSVLCYNHILSM